MSSPERRSWLIRKNAGAGLPFDHPDASIVGPDTDVVGVIPEQDAEQLREALQVVAGFTDKEIRRWRVTPMDSAFRMRELARAALKEEEKLDG